MSLASRACGRTLPGLRFKRNPRSVFRYRSSSTTPLPRSSRSSSAAGRCRLDPVVAAALARSNFASTILPDYWFVPETTAADRLEQWYRRFVMRDHLHFVERALRDSEQEGVVLDVGCGGGLFLQMLTERGA